jgi:nucleotide-binding universal stress UspA family protein
MTAEPTHSILVAVDFGDASARAIAVAGALARQWPARLRLLHAESAEAPAYFTHDQVEALASQRRELRSQAEAFLNRFGRQHTSAAFTTAIDPRPPAEAILEHAEAVDLVVMGTHGRRGPSRWWLGSVAERVLLEIDRPLLVVHAADDPARLFERVCVCAEPALSGERALEFSKTLTKPFGGAVVDRRREAVPVDAAARASLVVVAAHAPSDRAQRSALVMSRIRTEAGAVLFVPETAKEGVT